MTEQLLELIQIISDNQPRTDFSPAVAIQPVAGQLWQATQR